MKQYLFTIIVTFVIVVLSTIPIPEEAPLHDVPLIDKWVHMVMYGGLVFVMWIDHVVRAKRTFSWVVRVLMLLYSVALGGAMELVQEHLTTYRSGDLIDFEADAIGAVLGCLLCMGVNWKFKVKSDQRK